MSRLSPEIIAGLITCNGILSGVAKARAKGVGRAEVVGMVADGFRSEGYRLRWKHLCQKRKARRVRPVTEPHIAVSKQSSARWRRQLQF